MQDSLFFCKTNSNKSDGSGSCTTIKEMIPLIEITQRDGWSREVISAHKTLRFSNEVSSRQGILELGLKKTKSLLRMATWTTSLPYLLQILSYLLGQILCSPALVDDVLYFRGHLHHWWQHPNYLFVFQNPLGGIRVHLTLAFISQAHLAGEWEWFPGSELYLGLKTLTSVLAMWEGSRLEFVTFLTCASNCISIFILP